VAPALAATVAVGAGELWRHRAHPAARATLVVAVAGTAVWSWVLLGRSPQFVPWLRWVVLLAGAGGALGVWGALVPGRCRPGTRAWLAGAVVGAVVIGMLGGSVAYAAQTALTPQRGGGVSAGPRVAGGRFAGPGGSGGPGAALGHRHAVTGDQGGPGRHGPGQDGPGQDGPGFGGAGFGGAGHTDTVVPALADLLRTAGTPWSAATLGSQSAAGLELATGTSVIGVGGFTGTDDAPTLAQFQQRARTGQVHYLVVPASGGGRGARRGGVGQQISAWVQAHYPARTVGGDTVYDLAPAAP
jgi:hypothetical protein